eukprot:Gb_28205 [translate_table: standard]
MMAIAPISCNLEAIAIVGDVRANVPQHKNAALGWNPFKFYAPLFSPQQTMQMKTVRRSRERFGVCKISIRCIMPKEEKTDADGSRQRKWLEEKSLFGISSERAIHIILDTLKALQKPAMIAVLLGLLLTHDPAAALAASGGRMGGKAFSSGRGSGSYSSRTFSAPSSSFSYSVPYAAPSPFGFGGGLFVRPAYGIGFGASSGFFLLMLGFVAVMLVSGFLSDRSDSGLLVSQQKTSVLKLQVGLLGMARSIQKDLDRIAEISNTSTPEGLNYVLTETALALLRHPDYCISGYSSTDIKHTMEAGEERFNQLSIEERGKFDEETLVNVNSIRKRTTDRQRSDGFSNEYIVITILVAAEGEHKLRIINSSADLKEALKKLGSIPSNQTLAVEVLWTPQNENDKLCERELLQDYPLLRPL